MTIAVLDRHRVWVNAELAQPDTTDLLQPDGARIARFSPVRDRPDPGHPPPSRHQAHGLVAAAAAIPALNACLVALSVVAELRALPFDGPVMRTVLHPH